MSFVKFENVGACHVRIKVRVVTMHTHKIEKLESTQTH